MVLTISISVPKTTVAQTETASMKKTVRISGISSLDKTKYMNMAMNAHRLSRIGHIVKPNQETNSLLWSRSALSVG